MRNKDKEPRNSKGQPHGYWERYCYGKFWYKCFYHNGKEVGYHEWYYYVSGKLGDKRYNI